MEITGKLVKLLDTQRGTSESGEWQKTVAIFDISSGNYTDKLAITFFKLDPPREIGATYVVSVNPKSREYNGKWFTDIMGWKFVSSGKAETPVQTPRQQPQQNEQKFGSIKEVKEAATNNTPETDDLPF